jgi:PhnB protein
MAPGAAGDCISGHGSRHDPATVARTAVRSPEMSSIEPQLWTDLAAAAVAFYQRGFGAEVLHQVGDGDDIVAQLAVGDARFWVSAADPVAGRLDPLSSGGATGRTLLLVDDPGGLIARAVDAGATETSPVQEEHGWLLGRLSDPFGHDWEIGRPLGDWPPS